MDKNNRKTESQGIKNKYFEKMESLAQARDTDGCSSSGS